MYKKKIFDCVTLYNENLLVNSRFEILNEVVDYFIVVESKYDHKRNEKKINFKLLNPKFENKIRYILINENFPKTKNGWEIESFQREKISSALYDTTDDDLIMYSDSDEIPNPNAIKNLVLNKKYGIFLQKFFTYKINIFNKFETPWEGTRICKKKNLKTFTKLRKKIRVKNLQKPFWNFKYEKSINIIENGGWHFNNLYDVETISKKLKTFQHTDYSSEKFSDLEIIKNKINNLQDLFGRGHKYEKVTLDKTFPNYILENQNLFKDYIV